MNVAVLIPAYNPDERLVKLVQSLAASGFDKLVVVNDGSRADCSPVFEELKKSGTAEVIEHAFNMGKGAALKTGLDRAILKYRGVDGVVTADADGQHTPSDIAKVAKALVENPKALVLGARQFDKDVPWRSMFGNKMTRTLMAVFLGIRVTDTQTGLRGIPAAMVPDLLEVAYNRYEYELEMLLLAKRSGFPIVEVTIETIYLDGNASSHFNPVFDSAKIYFVLFRYLIAGVASAVVDFFVFWLVSSVTGDYFARTFVSRGVSLVVNYTLVRNMVFSSREKMLRTFPKYILLVIVSGFVSAILVKFFHQTLGIHDMFAKVIAESILFLANFVIQRDIIFAASQTESRTDWDEYYRNPYKTAFLSRFILCRQLLKRLRKYRTREREFSIVELGGGDSSFYDAVSKSLSPTSYDVYDSNALGLQKLRERPGASSNSALHIAEADILKMKAEPKADLAFSVGLIEHFDARGTRKAIDAHFDLVKPGGYVVLLFPTPTFLYKLTRFVSELLHLWIFHDERPLRVEEVESCVATRGQVISKGMIRSVLLTQAAIVARKTDA